MTTSPANPTILIVDDDESVINLFGRVLSTHGYHVQMASNADTALRHIDGQRPDAIIIDLRMPFIDGMGLLYRIRSREARQHVPVLLVTGQGLLSDELLQELSELGATVQYKPITPADLLAATRALIRAD